MWDVPRCRCVSHLLCFESFFLPLPLLLLLLCSFCQDIFCGLSELLDQRLTFSYVLALSQAEVHGLFSVTVQVSHLDFLRAMLIGPHVSLKPRVIRHEFDFDVLQCDQVTFFHLANGESSMGVDQSDLQN